MRRRRLWIGFVLVAMLGITAFLAIPVVEPTPGQPPTTVWEVLRDIHFRKRKAFDAFLQGDTQGAAREVRGIVESQATGTGRGR